MSVLMTMRVTGDPKAIESADQAMLDGVVERAKQHGLISHHFFGSDNEVLVIDEWPDQESFKAFFDSSPEIGEMMAAAGVTSQPTIEYWRPLDVNDSVGW
jgi:heme-degrading monooxygenase HmoA